jgi:hypothetical protein
MMLLQKLQNLTKGQRQTAIAKSAGIHQVTFYNILAGKHGIKVGTAVNLARVLGVSDGWLIDDVRGWPPDRVRPSDDFAEPGQGAKESTGDGTAAMPRVGYLTPAQNLRIDHDQISGSATRRAL